MTDVLADQPVLLLFVVVVLGALLGRVRLGGVGLGVAATVFAGLAVGGTVPGVAVPDVVTVLGLSLFVYTVGTASGPTLRAALRGEGRRIVVVGVVLLVATAGVALLVAALLGFDGATAAGVFAGALTNAPTLATVVEGLGADGADRAVVAFAVAYPVGMVVTLAATARVLAGSGAAGAADEPLRRVTVRARRSAEAVGTLLEDCGDVEVVRLDRAGEAIVATPGTSIEIGDDVTVLGRPAAVDALVERLGGEVEVDAFRDRDALDFRPVLVSRRDVAGRTVAELELQQRHGARITRVARGDLEWLASDGTRLELGDRVTLVAPPELLEEVAAELGDSDRRASEVDLLTVGLGLALGLALGAASIPVGPVSVQLGFAGGPLVVGLVLGALVRTGPLLWQVSQQASATLRQLGLALFLAGVGVNAGPSFVAAVRSPDAALWAVAAALVVAVPVAGVVALRRRLLDALGDVRDPAAAVGAAVAGAATQPAALALVEERGPARTDLLGYATLFPLGMVGKVVLGQVLVVLL